MKYYFSFLKNICYLFLNFYVVEAFAQDPISDFKSIPPEYKQQAQTSMQEIPMQVAPLQGSGVQRVGSVPIPVTNQSLELMNAPAVTLQRPQGIAVQPVPMSPRKLPYESTYMTGRIIYLNGVNINSIKNQDLENVNVRIDGSGNIYIDAPHYDISVEQSYHPLMPGELPKFQKTEFIDPNLPKGTYSKETGKSVNKDERQSPLLPKGFSTKVPIQEQAPIKEKSSAQGMDNEDNKMNGVENSSLNKDMSKEKAEKNE
ncbi:hypothetical protein QEJ31_05275 [Pigmentibacter sp. JX0631]|uniref:hypothetical protein n=1 Tax=Pigmentibacter sp. JX0631 TaxID=2976982 RepID=UPI0024692F54|nr:hypothetical protein [Pigmentibacter sp. JX0631]WGL61008.1 hypothetical protein QEJ31_05275 [Pigmentibacter sp. JX0631]